MRVKEINRKGAIHDLLEVKYPYQATLVIEYYADGDILYRVDFKPPAIFILFNKALNDIEKIQLVGGYIPDNLGEELKRNAKFIRYEELTPVDDLDPQKIEYYLIDSERPVQYFIRRRLREISQGIY